MVVNGVAFIEREVMKLTEKEFIRQCMIHWPGESKEVKRKRLKLIYQRIIGGGEE